MKAVAELPSSYPVVRDEGSYVRAFDEKGSVAVGGHLPGRFGGKGLAALVSRAAARIREGRAARAEERETKLLWEAMTDLAHYVHEDDRRVERPADGALRASTREPANP